MNLPWWFPVATFPMGIYAVFALLALTLGSLICLGGVVVGGQALAGAVSAGGMPRGWRVVIGLAAGSAIGLAGGVLGGALLALSEALAGVSRWTFAAGGAPALALGGAFSMLAGVGLGALARRHDARLWGALLGLALGLTVFRVVYGAGAGYGPELDQGVGPEVGLLYGIAGLLLGALLGGLFGDVGQWASSVVAPPTEGLESAGRRGRWRYPAIGALVGMAMGGAVALVGYFTGILLFILPRVGQIPDVQSAPTPEQVMLGVAYGFAQFLIGGALVGAVVGEMAAHAGGRWGARLAGVATALGLVMGAVIGLNAGLEHGDVGGPVFAAQRMVVNPAATWQGLIVGLVAGAAVSMLGWVVWRWAATRPAWRTPLGIVALLTIGLLVVALPLWFHPLFGVDIR